MWRISLFIRSIMHEIRWFPSSIIKPLPFYSVDASKSGALFSCASLSLLDRPISLKKWHRCQSSSCAYFDCEELHEESLFPQIKSVRTWARCSPPSCIPRGPSVLPKSLYLTLRIWLLHPASCRCLDAPGDMVLIIPPITSAATHQSFVYSRMFFASTLHLFLLYLEQTSRRKYIFLCDTDSQAVAFEQEVFIASVTTSTTWFCLRIYLPCVSA